MSNQNNQGNVLPSTAPVQAPVSVSMPVVPAPVEKEESFFNRTLDVMGYKLPYWVLVVALLVLFYLYNNGAFKGLLGTQSVAIADRSVLQGVPTGVTDGVNTPEVVRRLLSLRG